MSPISTFKKFLILLKLVLRIVFIDLPLNFLSKSPRKEIKGQVAVVTGGAQGIGREIALLLALKHEAKVALLDINYGGCVAVAKDIEKDGGAAFAFEVDVTAPESLRQVALNIQKHPDLGPANLLICNAGIMTVSALAKASEGSIRKTIDVNLLGTIWTIRAFLPKMIEQDSGHVISLCSIAGLLACPNLSAYCASKFALQGLMDALRWELIDSEKFGIKVSTIYPTFVKTNMTNGHRFDPGILGIMEPEEAAGKMMNAILEEQSDLCIPNSSAAAIVLLKWLLSLRAQETTRIYSRVRMFHSH